VTTIGLDDIGTSTPLESNKSLIGINSVVEIRPDVLMRSRRLVRNDFEERHDAIEDICEWSRALIHGSCPYEWLAG